MKKTMIMRETRPSIIAIILVLLLMPFTAMAQNDALEQELQGLQEDQAMPADAENSSLTDDLKAVFPGEEKNAVEEKGYTSLAVLQGLNKITARTSTIKLPLNKAVTFGTLEITVHQCWKASPEEMPENKVLMEIWEQKPGEEKSRIFNGWMFSSSPSISALEHPVYDVTVLECKQAKKKEE